ncbi:hypothetical protein [Actinophytocola sp.]|uniref:hypothetical protein n=1 Tax=Actinophytocola sp. TaxID=1872138 RepID=UPI002D80C15F|nr:hypothetical protein [Actinophytocola sp.]HET9144081.1 hypothetical protein [Actinophytocola sp.]
MAAITCGNRARHNGTTGTHATVDNVRRCYLDPDAEICNWLIEIPAHWVEEIEDIVDAQIVECGALAWELPDGRGWTCEAGHEHIHAEVRDQEGWDYAEDLDEANRLAKVGVASVQMDGRPWV